MKKSHLTLEQRYAIQAYLDAGRSITFIAGALSKDKSVVSRELKRNRTGKGKYTAKHAQMLCDIRKERFCRARKLDASMEKLIRGYIVQEQWSPEQIKGYCDRQGIPMVSHERIYQLVRQDKGLRGHTRHKLKHRKRPVNGKHQAIKGKRSIEERPAAVDQKTRKGDWEIDTIVGRENQGAIVTIVERKTGFLMMRKLPNGKQAEGLKKAVIDMLFPYRKVVHTITADNGTEFACHQDIAEKLKADFYFAHPYASWERGLNEYTNKLIRQYIPKKQSFDRYDDQKIKRIQYTLNNRPRKKLNFKNPKQLFYANLE